MPRAKAIPVFVGIVLGKAIMDFSYTLPCKYKSIPGLNYAIAFADIIKLSQGISWKA